MKGIEKFKKAAQDGHKRISSGHDSAGNKEQIQKVINAGIQGTRSSSSSPSARHAPCIDIQLVRQQLVAYKPPSHLLCANWALHVSFGKQSFLAPLSAIHAREEKRQHAI